MEFIGEYTVKVDDKGRLVFPSAFKSRMQQNEQMAFVVKKDIFEDCLEMFTYEEWEKRTEELKSKLNFLDSRHARFWREYMRGCAIVEPDPKFGRISIPRKLLEEAGIGKEAVFCGNGFKIEIWSELNYTNSRISRDEYISLADFLAQ